MKTKRCPRCEGNFAPNALPNHAARCGDTCSIKGCDRKFHANDMCKMHDGRVRRNGTPHLHRPTESERFWKKVEKQSEDGCWLWAAATTRGYGVFVLTNRAGHVYAHRWSYEKAIGPIPENLELDHLCCTPRCVNPSHLEPVTHAENVRRWAQSERG